MKPLAGIFAFLVATAGWYYLFYSRAALNLSAVEEQRLNLRRVRLRRLGGAVMLALAVCFSLLFWRLDYPQLAGRYLLLVSLLLLVIVLLALLDLRLTWKIRAARLRRGTGNAAVGRDTPGHSGQP